MSDRPDSSRDLTPRRSGCHEDVCASWNLASYDASGEVGQPRGMGEVRAEVK